MNNYKKNDSLYKFVQSVCVCVCVCTTYMLKQVN